MSERMTLNGSWELGFTEGAPWPGWQNYADPGSRRPMIHAVVPGPVHRALSDAGLLEDPNIGLNALRARWVEEQFWVYRRTFKTPAAALKQHAWLVFERLEYDAIVVLNGVEVGRHANAHRPARFDVTGRLVKGENKLVVRVAAGLHELSRKPREGYCQHEGDALTMRPWHRSAQYQFGWDWSPRLINVGILGNVFLEWSAGSRLDQASVHAVVSPDLSRATVHVRAWIEGLADEPVRGILEAKIRGTRLEASTQCKVAKGENMFELEMEMKSPRLWWPREHGEQHLYTLDLAWKSAGESEQAVLSFGARRVEIDQSPHPEQGRYCILKVNNRPVFCKGGNWVPPDLLYSTVGPDRIRSLIDLAFAANFNMLRIWGGGVFADHTLLDACDEQGILVWHDFLFACSKYPADHPEFVDEVGREIKWAVRELARHPSLVVWCGNNEIEWGDWDWNYDRSAPTHPHYALFHRDIPRIVRAENQAVIHWISSPFSPDYLPPNDPTAGDQHPWSVGLAKGAADWWKYREFVDRFPNEGGALGASSPATLRQFLPKQERRLLSQSWDFHDNTFGKADADNGRQGRVYQTFELWTGRDPFKMDMDEYAFASGLLQAESLCEYISNYRRRMFSSAAAVFWMFNDSWPVTHGWTIVDYYLRKKLAFHPVRRAFQPVTVVVVEEKGEVVVFGVNDSPKDWSGCLRYGLFCLSGGRPLDEQCDVVLPANASTALARFPSEAWDKACRRESGAFATLNAFESLVAQHRLFTERFKDLRFAEPRVSVKRQGREMVFTSESFVWGLCLDLDGEKDLPDNCFDLLPGIPYAVPWPQSLEQPKPLWIGSRDAVPVSSRK